MNVYVRPTRSPAKIRVATDGSSLGNPGTGAWAWYVDEKRWRAGARQSATNNQMELQAILEALRDLPEDADIEIYADSQYSINALTTWLPGWRRKGWRNSKGDPVANRELIEAIDAEIQKRLARGREVTFTHVKGHAGDDLNEAVDSKARGASEALRGGETPELGPGWSDPERDANYKGQGALF